MPPLILEPKWRKNLKNRQNNSPFSSKMGCFLVRRKGLGCVSAKAETEVFPSVRTGERSMPPAFCVLDDSSPFLRVAIPKKEAPTGGASFFGTPEGTRTPDLLVRSQSLYPTELPAHTTLSKRSSIVTQDGEKCKLFFKKIETVPKKRRLPPARGGQGAGNDGELTLRRLPDQGA